MADIYMPNDVVDGRTVIASVWLRDDDATDPHPISAIVTLELLPFIEGTENYRVNEYTLREDEWKLTCTLGEFFNINPAVACFADNGGDY